MALLSAFFGCFMPSSRSRVSSNNDGRLVGKGTSSEKLTESEKKPESSAATILVPYFPTTKQLSYL